MNRVPFPLAWGIRVLAASAFVVAGGWQAALAQDSTARPPLAAILKGAYNTDQAARGEATFNGTCSACHTTTDYTGEKFQKSWLGQTAFDLFERLRTTMPDDNPGALSRDEYVDVVAFLFKLNGYPPGDSALPPDDDKLRTVKIEPLPAGNPGASASAAWAFDVSRRRALAAARRSTSHISLGGR